VSRQLALGGLAAAYSEMTGKSSPSPDPLDGSEEDFMERILTEQLPFPDARERILDEFQRRYVARALERHGGDVARAASASGIGVRYLQKLRARHAK
jgi:DNA-binding NtrC family response regulator